MCRVCVRSEASDSAISDAAWVVCPMCDEPVCPGRFKCSILTEYVHKAESQKEDTHE